jgi:hypothetical protein
MKNRGFRWLCFLLALGFLAKSIFGETTTWSVAGFFIFGALWYFLTWRRTRELDAPRPR